MGGNLLKNHFYTLYIWSIFCSKYIYLEAAILFLPISPALSYLLKCLIMPKRDEIPIWGLAWICIGPKQPDSWMMYVPSALRDPGPHRGCAQRQHGTASIFLETKTQPPLSFSLGDTAMWVLISLNITNPNINDLPWGQFWSCSFSGRKKNKSSTKSNHVPLVRSGELWMLS